MRENVHILAMGYNSKNPNANSRLVRTVTAKCKGLGQVVVARCESANDLKRVVAYHGKSEGRVAILDIFDHGGPGLQMLGKEKLFQSDGTACNALEGIEIVEDLKPHLSSVAQIRLLGCLTTRGMHAQGRFLLIKLAKAFGGNRIVFGTIEQIGEDQFDEDGFAHPMIESYLYSSLAALDGTAPDRDRRRQNIASVNC